MSGSPRAAPQGPSGAPVYRSRAAAPTRTPPDRSLGPHAYRPQSIDPRGVAMSEAKVTTLPPQPARAAGAPAATRKRGGSSRIIIIGGIFLAIAAAAAAWFYFSRPALPAGFAGGNGRLEANQVFVSTKYPGRIAEVLFNEGDTVEAGQVIARMDTSALEAQLREAEA